MSIDESRQSTGIDVTLTDACEVCGVVPLDADKHVWWHRGNGDVTACRSHVEQDGVEYWCRRPFPHPDGNHEGYCGRFMLTWSVGEGGIG